MTTPTLTKSMAPPTVSAAAPASPQTFFRRSIRHSLVLARRNLIKTWRTPEQLIDVTLQPAIFLLLFPYVFGGALAAGHATNTYSSYCPACSARASRWAAWHSART